MKPEETAAIRANDHIRKIRDMMPPGSDYAPQYISPRDIRLMWDASGYEPVKGKEQHG